MAVKSCRAFRTRAVWRRCLSRLARASMRLGRAAVAMYTLRSYIAKIAEPTFEEFNADRGSARRAFLASVAIFHAIERAPGYDGSTRQEWKRESHEFYLVDILAHHLKHVRSGPEKIPATRPGLPIGRALGFKEPSDQLDLRNLYFVIRDALKFIKDKADALEPLR